MVFLYGKNSSTKLKYIIKAVISKEIGEKSVKDFETVKIVKESILNYIPRYASLWSRSSIFFFPRGADPNSIPVGTKFPNEVFSGFFLTCTTNVITI